MGFHNAALIHLVGQGLVQNPQEELAALRQFVKIGKEPCTGQSPVSGEDAVGAVSAHRQGGSLNLSHGDLQNGLINAVVDGQSALMAGISI